jgi:hypothetical protein
MPAVVQSVTGTATNTTGVLDLTLPSPTTLGNTVAVLVAAISSGGEATPASATLGGAAGNFTLIDPASFSDDGDTLSAWLDPGCAGSQTALAISSYGGAATYYLAAAAYEISGLEGSPLDVAAYSFGTGSGSWSVTGSATAQASEIWLGAVAALDASSAATLTGPGSPWTDTVQVTAGDQCALMAGCQITSSAGTPDYDGSVSLAFTGSVLWVASLITLKAIPTVTGTGSVALPVRGLSVAGGEKFSGSGAAAMPARSLAGTAHEVFRGAGGVVMPARALAGEGDIDSGVVMPPRALQGSGYVSPIGSGGVVMPSPTLAGAGSEVIHGTGSVATPTPSLSARSVTGDQGSGTVALPARRLSGSGVTAQQAKGSVRMPARALAGSGKVIISGHGGVQARKFTLSGRVGEQPRGSGGVVMPRRALAGTGRTRLSYVWSTPDYLHVTGGTMQ